MADTASGTLARYTAELTYDDIPPASREHATWMIIDSIGAGLYGIEGAASRIVFNEAAARYGLGTSPIWGRGTTLPPAGAALVNATQAHEFELDDYVPSAKVHPGAVVVPAALAVAGPGTSGRDLITAVVAGYDAMIRVSLAAGASATRGRGWHITGLTGPFGAAAAAGKLSGLKAEQLTDAFGVAGSSASGLFAFTKEGSMTKSLHAGRGAEAGVVAVSLAAAGFAGPAVVLDAEDGGLLKAVSDRSSADEVSIDLGIRFDVDQATVKPYACCGSIHSAIDALLEIMEAGGLAAAELAAIVVKTSPTVIKQCGFEYVGQGGPLEAKLSLQYCLAVAAQDREVQVASFASDRLRDPATLALARRVRFEVDAEVDALYPRHFSNKVEVTTTGGETSEVLVRDPLGTPENPLGQSAIADKFLSNAAVALGDNRAAETLAWLSRLEAQQHVTDLASLLQA